MLLQTVKEKMVKNYLKKRNLPSKGRIEKKPRRQSRSVFCWGPGREGWSLLLTLSCEAVIPRAVEPTFNPSARETGRTEC